MPFARSKRSKRINGMRLILQHSPSDDKLQVKVEAVGEEIEAIDQALSGDRTYLGITDKKKLMERYNSLESKISLLKEERELLQTLRVALAEEEECLSIEEAERADEQQRQQYTSSPVHRRRNKNDLAAAAAEAAVAAAAAEVAAEMDSPSPSLPAYSSVHHSSSVKSCSPYMSPPAPADLGVERFLKANADLAKPLGERKVGSSKLSRIRPIPFGNKDPHNDDDDG